MISQRSSVARLSFTALLFVVSLAYVSSSLALTMSPGLNTFWAFGQNFVFPGSARIGYQQWEGGILAPNFVGMAKSFSFSEKTYTSFGFGLDIVGTVNPAFSAATGYKTRLIWGLDFRAELISRISVQSFGLAHGLLGLSYDF